MYARFLQMKTKFGQARTLCTAAQRDILPILNKFAGFVDVMWTIPDDSPDEVLAVSWWESSEAADRFNAEGYGEVEKIYRRYVEGEIRVRKCEVTVEPTGKAQETRARTARMI
jgi:heme-degrading monooxygenase HmoA